MASEPKTGRRDNVTEVSSTQSSLPQSIEDAGSKAAFLATFTPQDDKDIMRKVDRRFLLLIGILYMTKNVGGEALRMYEILAYNSLDRLFKCLRGQSAASWRRQKHLDRAWNELERVQLGPIDLLRSSRSSDIAEVND